MNEKLIRTFLAAELPADARAYVARMQERLKTQITGIRWVRPEGIHLTLKFFGYITAADIAGIEEAVKAHTETAPSMTFSLSAVGGFPNLRHPRVLWMGLEGEIDRLAALQNCIETDMEKIGFPKEKRSFAPHLTLGRTKSPGGHITGLESALKGIERPGTEPFRIGELVLFKSDLKPDGAVYTKLARFPIGGHYPAE